jgi:hypothetical protein
MGKTIAQGKAAFQPHPDIPKIINILKNKQDTIQDISLCFIEEKDKQQAEFITRELLTGVKIINEAIVKEKRNPLVLKEVQPFEISYWNLGQIRTMVEFGTLITFQNGKYVDNGDNVLKAVYHLREFEQLN